MCETFVICLIAGTFVICLIIPFEHLLAVPKNIIVIIMMIIVCFETFIQCECCIGSDMQYAKTLFLRAESSSELADEFCSDEFSAG